MPTKGRGCCASIGDRPAVILRNHGLLAWGRTIAAGLRRPVDAAACLRDPGGAALRWAPAIPVPEAIARRCTPTRCSSIPTHRRRPGRVRRAGAPGRPHRRQLQTEHEGLHLRRRRHRRLDRRAAGAGRRAQSAWWRAARRSRPCSANGLRLHARRGAHRACRCTQSPTRPNSARRTWWSSPSRRRRWPTWRSTSRRCSARDTIVLTAMNGVPWWFLQGGFGGALAGTRLRAVDPAARSPRRFPRAHVIGCVVHCQLLARCAGRGAASLRQRADHRRALGRGDAARAARCAALLQRAGFEAALSDADPEGRLVQAVGQHDGEPDQRDDRRHHRPASSTTSWCAASSRR